jgi:Acetyltransferase (GNAT) domain
VPGEAARLVAGLEERFLVPVCTSRHAGRWVAGHRALSWPLLRAGALTAHVATVNGASVRIVTVGRAKRFETWLERLGAKPAAAIAGRASLRSPDALAALDADLVLAHVHRWAADAFRRAGWHTVPSAVRWQADAGDVPPSRPHRSLRSDFKNLERHRYAHELAGTASDWSEFFELMVEPEAHARFAGRAWIPSRWLRREFATHGTLHFVLRNGVRVAGCCVVPTAAGVWLPVSGVRHGDPELLAAGAGSAALAATLRWAADRGYHRVDFGRTTPFIDDGVAWVKQKWGFQPVPEPLAHLIAVRARAGCPPARELLQRHPVRIETGSGLGVFGGDDAGA